MSSLVESFIFSNSETESDESSSMFGEEIEDEQFDLVRSSTPCSNVDTVFKAFLKIFEKYIIVNKWNFSKIILNALTVEIRITEHELHEYKADGHFVRI